MEQINQINSEEKVIKLPKIICGQIIYPREGDKVVRLKYENNVVVEMPQLTAEDVEKIVSNRVLLHDIPIGEVTEYLVNTGKKMIKKDDELVEMAINLGSEVSGFSVPMFRADYFIIGTYISKRHHFYDMLDAELGSHHLIDEYVRCQVGKVRAYPRGRALHIMVGNVPLASMFSGMRSVLTKNQTIIKVPSRDPVTSTYFAMLMIAANKKDHPLSNSISSFYTEKDSEMLDYIKKSSDVVCAWGKGSALEEIKKTIPHSVPFLELGPKRSFSILFSENANIESAAMKMAHDISVYDQEACFSPQRLFVIGDYNPFVEQFKKYLDVFSEALPKGRTNIDAQSYLLRVKLEAKYRDWDISEGNGWTIIIGDPYKVKDHPLGRTMFIHPVKSVDELIPFIDDETQSVTVYPLSKSKIVADTLGPYGVQRICEMGMIVSPRPGFTHDGMYPLHYFVRLTHLDESVNYVNSFWDKEFFPKYYHTAFGCPKIENFAALMLDEHEID